jgi:malyl-CoA/(S)-citramalyl-CoA lyase
MVELAASSHADAVLLDLDNAGPVEEKRAALDAGIRTITNLDWGSKVLTVRLYAVDTPLIDYQLDLLSGLNRLDSLLIRRAEQVKTVMMVGNWLSAKKDDRSMQVELDLSIETALG